MTNKTDIRSLTQKQLEETFLEYGIEKYRARQVWQWLYKHIDSFSQMNNLPAALRAKLDDLFIIPTPVQVERISSKLDSTRKYLFTLQGGDYVESVLLEYAHGYSVCLSSQVGCKMGCTFCASSKAGFSRNLSASEILMQMEFITRDMQNDKPDFRIGHIVLMGIGEPLDNYENVLQFLRLANEKEGFGISYRNISLSTCGLVPKIDKLSEEGLPITLSVSLHAPTDEIRSRTMPVNDKYPIRELMAACHRYTKKTGRRISFEYALIQGVNDSPAHARILGRLLKGMLCHLNLINVNETKENNCKKTTKEALNLFTNELKKCKINVTLRRTMGADIEAACGQLRRKKMEHSEQ